MKSSHGRALLVATALVVGGWLAAVAQQAGKAASSGGASKNPVQEIELPEYPAELPAGPKLAVFQQHCLLCHSARYVTMQPRFSRTVWEKEVKKMVDVYGAPITAADQQQIVEYLVAIKGPADGK